jgi:hypothetical protein
VEIAREQEFHTGPVDLGDLIQETHIHLGHFVYPKYIARGRPVQNISPDPVVGRDPTGSAGSGVSLRDHVHLFSSTPEPLDNALDEMGLPSASDAQDQ